MKFLVCIDISLIIAITFFAMPKKLHPLEHVYLWMMLVFTFTSMMSVMVDNVSIWKLSEKTSFHSTFKLVQMIGVPMLIQLFIDKMYFHGFTIKGVGSFVSCTVLLLLYEWTLIWSGIIEHTTWNYFYSLILWVVLILLTLLLHYPFRKQLNKEGVIE